MKEIKFGVAVHLTHWPSSSHLAYKELDYNVVRDTVAEAEGLGYYSVWGPDHLMYTKKGFELWTTFSFLASITRRIRFHTGVLSNTFRRPSILAKMAATFDVLSGGRLDFGIGAGWHTKEHDAYGIPLPKPKTRIEMLEEAVRIIKDMWTGDEASFQGKYYTIKGALCEPKPLQKPHPPITIGGGGERYTLRVVAKLADRCNLVNPPSSVSQRFFESHTIPYGKPSDPLLTLEEYRSKLEVLKRHCREVNRDYNEIEKTITTQALMARGDKELKGKLSHIMPKHSSFEEFKVRRVVGTPEECIQKIRRYVDEAGVTYFQLAFLDLPKRESMKLFAEEVMPAFNK